ncbi:MAG: PrsW family intramembrane metalloprotease [Candidatus Altiarchaeota archaeon]|nr:PrsW family intramembrane metalloprotease [Candidatus Altiarchaeota archaeon]
MDWVINIVMVLLSFFVSSVPILMYIWFVWWLDHHDREPLLLIAVAFFWGAIASIAISLVFEVLFGLPLLLFSEDVQKVANYVVLAPVIEELAKSVILFALFFHPRFNRILDGVVYGAVIGFGFAASENLMYYVSTYFSQGVGIWAIVVILRTMFTSVGHAVFTSITGSGVALMKFSRQRWMRFVFPPMALLTAVVLHSVFNFGAVMTELSSLLFFFISIVIVFFGLTVVGIAMFLGLHDEESCIHERLAEEVRSGVVTSGEYEIVPGYLRRRAASFRILSRHGYEKYRLSARLFDYELDLAFTKDEMAKAPDGRRQKDLLKRVNELRDAVRRTRGNLGDAASMLK